MASIMRQRKRRKKMMYLIKTCLTLTIMFLLCNVSYAKKDISGIGKTPVAEIIPEIKTANVKDENAIYQKMQPGESQGITTEEKLMLDDSTANIKLKKKKKLVLDRLIPKINWLEPNLDGASSWWANTDFTIVGALFSETLTKNKINIIREDGKKKIRVKSLYPLTAARDRLTAKWPEDIENGSYLLEVEVENLGKSNKKLVRSVSPPLTGRPIINRIDPSRSYPGKTVLLIGENLRNMHLTWKMDPNETDLTQDITYTSYAERDQEYGSRNELRMTIPQHIMPGRYIIYTNERNPETHEMDPGRSFTVVAPDYSIQIKQIRISPPGGEEIVNYLYWGLSADTYAWTVYWERMGMNNPIYTTEHGQPFLVWKDVILPEGGRLFPINGDSKKVKTYLMANVQMYQQRIPREIRNQYDPKTTRENFDRAGDIAQGIFSLFGPEGAAVGAIANKVLDAFGWILGFGSEPPPPRPGPLVKLGDLNFTYDANDLQKKTKTNGYFEDKVRYDVRGRVTIEIYYKITRHEPENH